MNTKESFCRPFRVEVCVESWQEALMAENLGADQVEICEALDVDGLTPSVDLMKTCISKLRIPIKVLIRPREGNFEYREDEISQVHQSIQTCLLLGVKEIVIGFTSNGELDIHEIVRCLDLAAPMDISIHKAIDTCLDPVQEVRQLVKLGRVKSILTSGGSLCAKDGLEVLKKMKKEAQGKLEIIPAGRITNRNISAIHKSLGCHTYHGRRILGSLRNKKTRYQN